MAAFDNVSGVNIENPFYINSAGTPIEVGDIDTAPFQAIFITVDWLETTSGVTSFTLLQHTEDDLTQSVVTPDQLIGSLSDFEIAQGAPVPITNTQLPTVGLVGNQRFISIVITTTNTGTLRGLIKYIGLNKIQPYES